MAKEAKTTKPSPTTIRAITMAGKKLNEEFKDDPIVNHLKQDALNGIAHVRSLVGVDLQNNGKLSPLGHMAGKQAGLMDLAILSAENDFDFAEIVKYVAKANPKSRKTDPNDTKKLLTRLLSHYRNIAGLQPSGTYDIKRRLEKVGKADLTEEVANSLVFGCVLFEDYVHSCSL